MRWKGKGIHQNISIDRLNKENSFFILGIFKMLVYEYFCFDVDLYAKGVVCSSFTFVLSSVCFIWFSVLSTN